MKQINARVLANDEIATDYYKMVFTWDPEAGDPLPGQFITMRVADTTVPLCYLAVSEYQDVPRVFLIINDYRAEAESIYLGHKYPLLLTYAVWHFPFVLIAALLPYPT